MHVHDPLYLTSWVAAFWCLLLRTPYVVHRHVGFVHHSSLVVAPGAAARARHRRAAGARPARRRSCRSTSTSRPAPAPRCRRRRGSRCWATASTPRASARRARRARRIRRGARPARWTGPSCCSSGGSCRRRGSPTSPRPRVTRYDLVFVGGDRPAGGGRPPAALPRRACRPPRCRASTACADVMVVASVGECPLTVLEAMSSGLPVVANDDPALHSPWTAGPGVRFVDMAARRPPRRPRASWSPIRTRLRADGRGRPRRSCEASFSWDAHLDRLERTLYSSAVLCASLE